MMVDLFPKFLQDPRQYERSRRHWADLLRDATGLDGQAGSWTVPWFSTLEMDGNPIFSAVCPDRGLGLRVIQFGPEEVVSEDQLDFGWYLDKFQGDGPVPIRELVISCSLSAANSEKAASLIRHWVRQDKLPWVEPASLGDAPEAVGPVNLAWPIRVGADSGSRPAAAGARAVFAGFDEHR